MKKIITFVIGIGILGFACIAFSSGTTVSLPQLSIQCDYSDCNIGSGKRSCQLTDSNGGMITVNGVSSGQCGMFEKKTIVWEKGGNKIKAKVVKSKEIERW
jgi:hypothetical protein